MSENAWQDDPPVAPILEHPGAPSIGLYRTRAKDHGGPDHNQPHVDILQTDAGQSEIQDDFRGVVGCDANAEQPTCDVYILTHLTLRANFRQLFMRQMLGNLGQEEAGNGKGPPTIECHSP